jgi:phosphatidylserine/phosphatidylglycerophosphate/cardiolipin synthase-like enzyme
MKKNAEINVAIYDRPFATRVEAMVREDIGRCDVLTKTEWKKRGFFARVGETFFWLFSENY